MFVPANFIHILCSFSWMCLSLWPVSEKTAKLVPSLRSGLCICFTSFTLVLSYGTADSCAQKIFERVAPLHNPHLFSSLDFCASFTDIDSQSGLFSRQGLDRIGPFSKMLELWDVGLLAMFQSSLMAEFHWHVGRLCTLIFSRLCTLIFSRLCTLTSSTLSEMLRNIGNSCAMEEIIFFSLVHLGALFARFGVAFAPFPLAVAWHGANFWTSPFHSMSPNICLCPQAPCPPVPNPHIPMSPSPQVPKSPCPPHVP